MVFIWDDVLLAAGTAAASGAVTGGISAGFEAGRTAKTRKQHNKNLLWERDERQRQISDIEKGLVARASMTTLGGGIREGTHAYALQSYSIEQQRRVLEDTKKREKPKPKGLGKLFEGIFGSFFGD